MKARTRTTRWLLIALLFGFLAAVGLTLSHRHGSRAPVAAKHTAPPTHTVVQPPPLVASARPRHIRTSVNTRHYQVAVNTHSNSQAPAVSNQSDPLLHGVTAGGTGWSSAASGPSRPIGATQPPVDRLVASNSNLPPQAGAGDFAYDGYVPLDCELPAGCGVAAGTGYAGRQPLGTSAGVPSAHNSQGSNSGEDDPGPQTNDGGPPPNDNGPVSDPPGQSPGQGSTPVAAAPELDLATLAGAVTLLLGSLAVLRGRRARANR